MQTGTDNRTLIVEAARLELAACGYEAMSMRSIARRVGFDPRLVHYYFGTKQELTDQALRSARLRLVTPFRAVAGPPGRRLVRHSRASWRRHRQDWQAVGNCTLGPQMAGDGLLVDALEALVRIELDRAPAAAGGGPPAEIAVALVTAALLGNWLLTEAMSSGRPRLPAGFDAALGRGLDGLLERATG